MNGYVMGMQAWAFLLYIFCLLICITCPLSVTEYNVGSMTEKTCQTNLEALLEQDKKLIYTIRGISMLPLLRSNKDLVIIEVVKNKLKPLDVAFYRREGRLVLHRVIAVSENDYCIRGDNTYRIEHIPEKDVMGILTGFVRNGRQYTTDSLWYRMYSMFWCGIYPIRAAVVKTLHFFRLLRIWIQKTER